MPDLTYKQKQEYFRKYLDETKVNFGNSIVEEKVEEFFIHAMTIREDLYLHSINEFKDVFMQMQRIMWDEQFKYLTRKFEEKASN